MGPINSYEFPAPFATVQNDFTLMAWCCTVEAPLLMHWSRCSLALPGLRLDVHYALYRSCKNYAYHWHVSFLCFNELMLRDYSAISHWFCICLCVTVAIKTSWILNLESWIEENAFENVVWKKAAILSRPQCVKSRDDALNEESFRWAHYFSQETFTGSSVLLNWNLTLTKVVCLK